MLVRDVMQAKDNRSTEQVRYLCLHMCFTQIKKILLFCRTLFVRKFALSRVVLSFLLLCAHMQSYLLSLCFFFVFVTFRYLCFSFLLF